MKWRVVIRPRGEADLREARKWYENQRAGLGDEFLAELGITILRLVRNPERRPVYYRGFRRILTRRFPYRLEGDRIIVFRVLHAHRDHPRLLPPDRGDYGVMK